MPPSHLFKIWPFLNCRYSNYRGIKGRYSKPPLRSSVYSLLLTEKYVSWNLISWCVSLQKINRVAQLFGVSNSPGFRAQYSVTLTITVHTLRLSWLSGNRRVFIVLANVSAIFSWLSSELKCDSGAAWPAYIRWLLFIHTWCVLIGPSGLLTPDQWEGAVLS